MSGLNVSDSDRDLLIRTVIGEAGDQPDVGKAGVANVVLNRMAAPGFGDSVRSVVLAPNQFEPWSNRGAELMAIPSSSPRYKQVGNVVDSVLSGNMPDVTGGATHFYAPLAQAAMGRRPPKWDDGNGLQIGGHLFFSPNGSIDRGAASDAIDKATGVRSVGMGEALGYTGTPAGATPSKGTPAVTSAAPESDFFKDMGIDPKGGKAAAAGSSSTPATGDAGGSSFFADMGITPPSGTVAATPASASTPAGPLPAETTTDRTNRTANAALGGFLNGIPIVGPTIKDAGDKLGAAARALLNNTRYSDELDFVRQATAQTAAEHPYVNTAGNVAGAAYGYGMGAAAGGAKLLGMTGGLPTQMGYGLASGTAIGTADSAARGENLLTGAGFGMAGGFGGPILGKLAGAGVNKLTQGANYLLPTGLRGTGISPAAANIAGQMVAADDPAAIRSFLAQHGPLATIADAGPSSMGLTSSLAMKPSEAKTAVTNMLTQRASGTVNRLTGDVDAALGPATTPSRTEAGIQANREALGPAYDQALQGARAVDTRTLASTLETSAADLRGPAASAVRDVRRMLDIPGTNQLDPSPRALLSTRNAIDGLLQNENNPQVIRQLTIARQSVDGELGTAVPGIKAVDGRYQELQRQSGALREGGNVLDSGKTALRPQELAETFPASANPEGQLIGPSAAPVRTREGVRAEVDRLVGTKSNDLVALKGMLQGEGGWNTSKLGTVFGQEPTNLLLGSVGREAAFARTHNDVLLNSYTAARQAGGKLLDETAPGSLNLLPATGSGIALQAAKKMLADPIIKALVENPTAPRNLELARIMTAQGANRDQILDALLRLNKRRDALSAGGNALTGGAGSGVNLLLRGATANGELRPAY